MMVCDLSKCGSSFADRDCKCYVTQDVMNLKGITDEERKRKMDENQFCGFESTDGFVYACDPGCCKNPCPGQCAGAKPRPPEGTYVDTQTQAQVPRKTKPLLELILLFVVALILISTLSLLA